MNKRLVATKTILLVGALLAVTLALGRSRVDPPKAAWAQEDSEWTVSVIIHELHDLDDNDASGAYDFYHHIVFSSDPLRPCDNEEEFIEGYHIYPNWTCAHRVSGEDRSVFVTIWIYDDDWPSGDDLIDVHPQRGDENSDRYIMFEFWPATHALNILGVDDDGDGSIDEEGESACARGRIEMAGAHNKDRARIVFTVTGTVAGARNGDSDADGLSDADEVCGMDSSEYGSGDDDPDVDLPGLGADPFRKDLFVELDWMVDDDGVPPADHSHEPWLPALLNAWHEFDQAPVTNPPAPDGAARPGGIALHVDVGTLYANYDLDFDGDGVNEISVGADGNVDVNLDGQVDIGNLGELGQGTFGGGNRVCANLLPGPCVAPFEVGEDPVLSPEEAQLVRDFNFVEARAGAFRYALFAHLSNSADRPTASGWAPWGGLDFLVSLGARRNQGGGLTGPSGLPVRGRIGEHTGTFLHELGHGLGLGHGGAGDDVNRKPNYVSIMSYDHQFRGISYDLDGDGMADPLYGFDFDHDRLPDGQRYTYSRDLPRAEYPNPADPEHPFRGGLPPLSELFLDEPEGVGDDHAIVFYGPSVDLDGDGFCDRVRLCPRSAVGNQPIDWNRDGDFDDEDVSTLAFVPPDPPGIHLDINRDGQGIGGDLFLLGSNDYNHLQNHSLKGVDSDEDDAFVRNLVRVTELSEAQAMAACDAESTGFVKFEDLFPGAVVTDQYADLGVHFLADDVREPTVAGPPQRFGLPTFSPPNSLVNLPVPPADSRGIPLVITFDPPVRVVSLRLGRVTEGEPATDLAVLTAYDADGFPMGSIQRAIPDFNQGITAHLAMGAIFPQLLISRVELDYVLLTANVFEPEHIDDLVICRNLVDRDPSFPDQPAFGEQVVNVEVTAEVRYPVDTGNEVEPRRWEGAALSDIAVEWQRLDAGGEDTENTPFPLTLDEGERLALTAAAINFHPDWGPLTFLYWREGENIYFSRGEMQIAAQVLRNTSFTAVYRAEPYRIYLPLTHRNWPPTGPTPTRTPTLTKTPTPTPSPTNTPTPTDTPPPTTIVLTPVADAHVSLAFPDTSFGTAPTLYVGKSESSIGRGLFQFDLSGIPAGSTVISATFQAYLVAFSTTPPSLDVELKQVDDSWTELGVTWNSQPGTTSIGKVNGVGVAMRYYDWDVAGLVQDWIDGTANHGLALWSYEEATYGWRGFASRESPSPPYPPQLVITYRP